MNPVGRRLSSFLPQRVLFPESLTGYEVVEFFRELRGAAQTRTGEVLRVPYAGFIGPDLHAGFQRFVRQIESALIGIRAGLSQADPGGAAKMERMILVTVIEIVCRRRDGEMFTILPPGETTC